MFTKFNIVFLFFFKEIVKIFLINFFIGFIKIMCSLKVRHQVSPKAKISLPNGQKSVKARKKLADKMSGELRIMLQNAPKEALTSDKYKNMIQGVIGTKNVDLKIKQVKLKGANATFKPDFGILKDDEKNEIGFDYTGYVLSFNLKNDRINSPKDTIMHESRHLFDHLCNPKYTILRQAKFLNDSEKLEQYKEVVNFTVGSGNYSPKRIFNFIKIPSFEKELRPMLAGLEPQEIVNILQYCRYYLETEKNAYRENIKYFIGSTQEKVSLGAILKYSNKLKRNFEFREKKRVFSKLIKEYAKADKIK